MSASALLAAAGAGLLSFLSPCVLPVVPGYLAVLAGFDAAEEDAAEEDAASARRRARVVGNAALFCAGFGAVFVGLGLTATAVGALLVRHHAVLTRISGGAVLLLAIYLGGSLVLRAPALYGEHRFRPRTRAVGGVGSAVAGVAFGFGWTPCLGPVLGSILAVAATHGRAAAGATLLAAYATGLAAPFLCAGLGYGHLAPALRRIRRIAPAATLLTVAALLPLGVLLVFDRLGELTAALQGG